MPTAFDDPVFHEMALEAGAIGMWSWNASTDAVTFDPRAIAVTGDWPHSPTLADFRRSLHPADLEGWLSAWEDAVGTSGQLRCEIRLIRPVDGSVRWLAISGRLVSSGTMHKGMVGILRDITEYRSVAAAAEVSSRRFSAIVEIAADAIVSVDERFAITLFNDGAEAIFGYARAEVLGQPLDILLPEGSRDSHRHHIRDFGGAPVGARKMGERQEIIGRRKSGEQFFAEASISKVDVGGGRTYTAVLRDVSARRQAAAQLENSKRLLEVALEVGQIGIFEHDFCTGAVFWSPIYRRMLGLDGQRRTDVFALIRLTPREDRRVLVAALQRALDPAGTGTCSSEHRIVRPDGTIRWLALRAHTTFVDSKPERIIGAVIDITERKLSQTQLEAEIEARTRELRLEMRRREESQAQLVRTQRMEAFGQLTGGIAHDFNNLLTVITGNLELLEMRLADEKQRLLLGRAYEAAEMGARLTSRLLTFARRRQLAAQLININELVIDLAELLERTIGEPITLTTSLESSPWKVFVDPSEVENAILNLSINARDAMPNGGKLIIETTNVEYASVRASDGIDIAPGQYVRLSVSDTGTGMTPDVLRRAFEPFFTTKEHGRGTGLGLSTIYGFAQQSKGAATIYSEIGSGTTVNLYLPRTEAEAADEQLKVEDGPIAIARGERILLVEDNPNVREVVRYQLEALGYAVIEADGGPAAIKTLAAAPAADIDLVLSDVVMAGGMSGFDVARWIATNRPSLGIVLASGYPDDVLKAEMTDWRETRLLRKPFSRAELARTLRQVLDRQ